jgi:ADP-ribosylation factor-like protein 5B
MGLLLSNLWKKIFGMDEFKMCIVGLDNAGKTTMLYKLHLGEVVATQPTIGSNVEQIEHNNTKITAWDLGGQDQLRNTWSTYFTNTHALVMVVDSTDRERMGLAKDELHRCLEMESLKSAVVLVFANKQDLPTALSAAELSNALDLVSIKLQSW